MNTPQPFDPLYTPGKDRSPDVYDADFALRMAREALERSASSNVHSHSQMLTAAIDLDWALRQLVVALDAERGETR